MPNQQFKLHAKRTLEHLTSYEILMCTFQFVTKHTGVNFHIAGTQRVIFIDFVNVLSFEFDPIYSNITIKLHTIRQFETD